MKKIYQNPTTIVVKLAPHPLMAPFSNGLNADGASGSQALGRQRGKIWDDDDEE